MNDADVDMALKARIDQADLGGLPVIYPNNQTKQAVPYVVVQVTFNEVKDDTIDGSKPIIPGFMIATVVTSEGIGPRDALTTAGLIKALFPMGYRISLADGIIEVKKQPSVLSGFPQGGAWRQPVKIIFEAG